MPNPTDDQRRATLAAEKEAAMRQALKDKDILHNGEKAVLPEPQPGFFRTAWSEYRLPIVFLIIIVAIAIVLIFGGSDLSDWWSDVTETWREQRGAAPR